MDIRQVVNENPLLAILRNVPTEDVVDYAGAIMEGGVSFFEVALNSAQALDQISLLRKRFGNRVFVGAGTVIRVDLAQAAVDAGAQFLLSPSANEDVLQWCRNEGVAMLPGALTPTDVSLCVRYGFSVIKLFPAGDMPKGYIRSLKGPFDGTDYVAIGGVSKDNAAEFIRRGYLGVGLGSNILPKEAIARKDWSAASCYVGSLLSEIRQAKSEFHV